MSGSRKGSEICTEGVGELDVRLQEGVRDLHGRGRRRGRRSARKGSETRRANGDGWGASTLNGLVPVHYMILYTIS